MGIRYVTNADNKGWLKVRYTNNSTYPPLPQHLKVNHQKTENGRDYFVIMAGRNKGKSASVKLKGTNVSYLTTTPPPHTGSAVVKFNITSGKLWYGSHGPVSAKTMPGNPVPVGKHDLEIPYEVHSLASSYLGQSKYATTWFRVGHGGDRFLHPGRISAGCVTVTNIPEWTKIYEYLIKARKGDDKSVGTIEVVR
jgi:hypothetical protein